MVVRWLYALIAVTCVLAGDVVEERKSKLPYIADAVGNKIPPPSNGPAPVGSPSNLLTPDRYEFYTFDESGELVKRLMTLEEIQAIVAAGEGTEGHLVTFANDEQPNISFNFSQAPFTKVHNVVTNVQNVLKAQMEAQKNNPPIHTTLDTPDVSDSWSLILPTIFGNTGAEIVPDKSSNSHTVPETDTLELDFDENSLSKESDSHILNSSPATSKYEESDITTAKSKEASIASTESTTTTTTTAKPTTTTAKPTTTTAKPTTTTAQPTTTTTATTAKPTTTTTSKPNTSTTLIARTTTITTTKPRITQTTTSRPRTTSTTTTVKPRTTSTTTTTTAPKTTPTTRRPASTTLAPKRKVTSSTTTFIPRTTTTVKPLEQSTTTKVKLTTRPIPALTTSEYNKIQTFSPNKVNAITIAEKYNTQEKVTSYIPVSTVQYVTTERIAAKSTESPKITTTYASTTKRSITTINISNISLPSSIVKEPAITTYKPIKVNTFTTPVTITPKQPEMDRIDNATTITTQSVPPSTTISTTEYMLVENKPIPSTSDKQSSSNQNEYEVPYFDIAQSISQIASELDDDQIPNKNTLDTTKSGDLALESKESVEMDINDVKNTETKTTVVPLDITTDSMKFVKISTLNPPLDERKGNKTSLHKDKINKVTEIPQTVKKESERPQIVQKESEKLQTLQKETESPQSSITTIDPILFESMDDLFSQIIEQNPPKIQTTEKSELSSSTVLTNIIKTPVEENKISTVKNTPSTMTVTEVPIKSLESANKNTSTKSSIPSIATAKIGAITESFTKSPVINTHVSEQKIDEKYVKISTMKEASFPLSTSTQISIITENIPERKNTISDLHKEKESIKKFSSTMSMEHSLQTTPSSFEKIEPFLEEQNKKTDSYSVKIMDQNKKVTSTTAEQNKVQSVQKTNKIPDLKPKIDEFKKKIQKVNIDDKELVNDRNSSWKLISTVKPPNGNETPKDKVQQENNYIPESDENKDINLDVSQENQGLAVTTKELSEDIAQFTELCNELAFRYWHSMTENIEKKRSFVLSPYSVTSMLAMMFMGARGATSGEMNEILKLDDMVTFNPHFTLKNISDSIETTPEAGIVVSAFIRELYSDRNKGKILTFYKERAQHFYSGHVEEINFKLISDVIRRRTNLLVKRYTWGRISEYMKTNSITMQPPLAALSTNIFQTDCSGTSVEGRDGEMYFVVSPTVRQRRLVPVPAVVYKKGFLAGYDPVLDATAAALGNTNSIVSTLFLMPGQQGNVVHADDLEALERRLLDSHPTTEVWNRLLRTLLPRIGLELQIPRFSHKSVFNVSSTLKTMGLKELFDEDSADLGGLNGPSKDLYLSDMVQLTSFVTCGEGIIGEQHHMEEYPERLEPTRRRRTSRWASGWDEPRDYQRAFHDPHDVGDAMHLPLHLRPRQARLPSRNAQPARLKFDRPFLFFVRHNPSGMILYVGRYNPRLLP